MPYVNQRWLGGMLTNFETIAKRVAKMQEYQRMRDSGEFEAMPKKEALILGRELEKLERNLSGIRAMARRPDAVFVLDTKKEHLAVAEANKLGIPVVAVVDTNCDPDLVQYVIPGNDDAIRASHLMCRVIADAVIEGRYIASKRSPAATPAPAAPVRSPEEEAAFRSDQAQARRQAAAAQAERDARLSAQRAVRPADEAAAEPAAAELTTADQPAAEPAAAEPTTADQPAAAEPTTADQPAAESPAAEESVAAPATADVSVDESSPTTEAAAAADEASDLEDAVATTATAADEAASTATDDTGAPAAEGAVAVETTTDERES
jgi:small subunit ribosomal protein S2